MSINNKLGQEEAATGLLKYARKNYSEEMQLEELWCVACVKPVVLRRFPATRCNLFGCDVAGARESCVVEEVCESHAAGSLPSAVLR